MRTADADCTSRSLPFHLFLGTSAFNPQDTHTNPVAACALPCHFTSFLLRTVSKHSQQPKSLSPEVDC